MNPAPNAFLAALARAWRASVKAFTPTEAPASQQYGTDTTLFGGAAEQTRNRRAPEGVRNEFWVPSETTDLAELEPERDAGPRRRDR